MAIELAGRILLPDGARPGAVTVDGGRITAIAEHAPPGARRAAWVAPGFIDLQVNGGFGIDLASQPSRVGDLAARLPATGVTGFLPTLISATADVFERWAMEIMGARGGGVRVLGLHLEGPFLSPERPGAHDVALIRAADDSSFERMLELPGLRLATMAPERPGALQRIGRLVERGVAVSLGHTAADFDQMRAGIDAGACLVTHVYNAMTGFSHRAPGALGAALLDDRVAVGLIADGVHAHPAAVELAVRAAGAQRIALVTDAMAGAGMTPGRTVLAGREVVVDEDSARLPDGTLAGSILTLDQAVRNAARWWDPLESTCRHASLSIL